MTIAIFCPTFGEYAGIGRIARTLAREFRVQGHTVLVIARPGSETPTADVAAMLRLTLPQTPRPGWRPGPQTRFLGRLAASYGPLRRFLQSRDADVLLSLGISTFAPFALLASTVVPVVLSLQGGEPSGRLAARPAIFRALLRRSRGIAACARSLREQALRLAPSVRDRITVIPNGVDPERFETATPHGHSRPYLLAVGRLTRQKGFDVLLDALPRVPAVARGRADLLVAGDGPDLEALRSRAAALGLDGNVLFLGAMDAERLVSLYHGARLVAVPSRWEGLPLVCLEAMASGRPVVATTVDGIPDAVVDEETGLLVPPERSDALAAAITRLLDDPARASRLGDAGRTRARMHFAWPALAQRHLELLARAVASPSP